MDAKRCWTRILFLLYSVTMLWLLFGRGTHDSGSGYLHSLSVNINLIPFLTTADLIRNLVNPPSPGLLTHAWINLFGNVAVFVPLGVFLPLIWEKARKLGRFFLLSSGIIAVIELLQLFTLRGIMDVDDYLLNMVGLFLGFLVYRLFSRIALGE